MSGSKDHLSTQEFAKKAGVSPSTVSKWLRTDKISGQKKGRKWIISPSELAKVTSVEKGDTEKGLTAPSPAAAKGLKPKSVGNKHLTILEFSEMTYLTEYGVKKLLKDGRLLSVSDKSGQLMVDSSNLERPNIKRLIR